MTAAKREITRDDIIPIDDYARERKAHRAKAVAVKKNRRVEVGPVCSFYFESYETMWHQVHEMLFIERGGAAQIPDELAAYNPLVPKGDGLVATVMFEIDDPARRGAFLAKLGGVEETAFLEFAGATVAGVPEADVDRTTAAGKASAVQFIHFPMTPDQAADFKAAAFNAPAFNAPAFNAPGAEVVLGFRHPAYAHMAVLPDPVRAALAGDLD